jgi:hypothetical protein
MLLGTYLCIFSIFLIFLALLHFVVKLGLFLMLGSVKLTFLWQHDYFV